MSVPPPNGWGGDLGCVIYETQSELTELTRKKIAVVIFLGKLADSQEIQPMWLSASCGAVKIQGSFKGGEKGSKISIICQAIIRGGGGGDAL